jgi:hypothetical protein
MERQYEIYGSNYQQTIPSYNDNYPGLDPIYAQMYPNLQQPYAPPPPTAPIEEQNSPLQGRMSPINPSSVETKKEVNQQLANTVKKLTEGNNLTRAAVGICSNVLGTITSPITYSVMALLGQISERLNRGDALEKSLPALKKEYSRINAQVIEFEHEVQKAGLEVSQCKIKAEMLHYEVYRLIHQLNTMYWKEFFPDLVSTTETLKFLTLKEEEASSYQALVETFNQASKNLVNAMVDKSKVEPKEFKDARELLADTQIRRSIQQNIAVNFETLKLRIQKINPEKPQETSYFWTPPPKNKTAYEILFDNLRKTEKECDIALADYQSSLKGWEHDSLKLKQNKDALEYIWNAINAIDSDIANTIRPGHLEEIKNDLIRARAEWLAIEAPAEPIEKNNKDEGNLVRLQDDEKDSVVKSEVPLVVQGTEPSRSSAPILIPQTKALKPSASLTMPFIRDDYERVNNPLTQSPKQQSVVVADSSSPSNKNLLMPAAPTKLAASAAKSVLPPAKKTSESEDEGSEAMELAEVELSDNSEE